NPGLHQGIPGAVRKRVPRDNDSVIRLIDQSFFKRFFCAFHQARCENEKQKTYKKGKPKKLSYQYHTCFRLTSTFRLSLNEKTLSNCHSSFYMRVRIVILQLKIIKFESKNILHGSIDLHRRQRPDLTGQLYFCLYYMIGI